MRKPGRPRKYGRGRINATVRFTPERYEQLQIEANRNGRSISEQVEYLVEMAELLKQFTSRTNSEQTLSHPDCRTQLTDWDY